MHSRIVRLERDLRWLKAYASISTVGLLLVVVAAFRPQGSDDGILRAKGLIIVDEAGRERILLGAPIPEATSRVRTDMERVRKAWAGRYPDPEQYLGYYAEYNHSMNGLLILDESGFDRVAVGDPVPDPNIGKRIGPSTGVLINDEEGFERSGYGVLKVEDMYRVVLGLDSDKGGEGLVLFLDDAGRTGLLVRDQDLSAYLGSAPAGEVRGVPEKLFGLVLRDGEEVREILNVGEGQ